MQNSNEIDQGYDEISASEANPSADDESNLEIIDPPYFSDLNLIRKSTFSTDSDKYTSDNESEPCMLDHDSTSSTASNEFLTPTPPRFTDFLKELVVYAFESPFNALKATVQEIREDIQQGLWAEDFVEPEEEADMKICASHETMENAAQALSKLQLGKVGTNGLIAYQNSKKTYDDAKNKSEVTTPEDSPKSKAKQKYKKGAKKSRRHNY